MSFFEKVKLVMSSFFTSFLMPLFKAFFTGAGTLAMQLAMKYIPVIGSEMASGTWREKQDEVIARMKQDALEQGIALSTTICINAIQAAYMKLNPDKVPPQ